MSVPVFVLLFLYIYYYNIKSNTKMKTNFPALGGNDSSATSDSTHQGCGLLSCTVCFGVSKIIVDS